MCAIYVGGFVGGPCYELEYLVQSKFLETNIFKTPYREKESLNDIVAHHGSCVKERNEKEKSICQIILWRCYQKGRQRAPQGWAPRESEKAKIVIEDKGMTATIKQGIEHNKCSIVGSLYKRKNIIGEL